ncbi:MAG: hypothetical protein V3T23_00430 [Nitrososphaerales archaeon]
MSAWSSEVGEDCNLDSATTRVYNSIDDMIEEIKTYPISKITMPVGNDFMHFDNFQKRTTSGMHQLDADQRYGAVYLAALRCLSYMVERALEFCDEIELLYVPGNHDYTASFGLCVALAERFRNDPRVISDLTSNPRKYRTHGGTLIGFHHGNGIKATSYPVLVATESKELWATSTCREMHIGHTHQKREVVYHALTPTNGITIRTQPSLSATDAWHHSHGYTGEPLKSVEAQRYDKTGLKGTHVAFARDDSRK